MLRRLEIAVAAALALAAHALLLLAGDAPQGAASAAGGGGGVIVVADEQIETLVAAWSKPPTSEPKMAAPRAPALDLPGLPQASPAIDRSTDLPPEPPEKPEEKTPEAPEKPKQAAQEQPEKKREREKSEPKPKSANAAGARGAAGSSQASRDSSGRGSRSASGSGRSSPSALREWGSRIRADISRKRRYPSDARRRRVEGRVVLLVRVSRSGALLSARIRRGSGSRELDAAALQASRAAAPFPAAPAGVTDAARSFAIPLNFKIH